VYEHKTRKTGLFNNEISKWEFRGWNYESQKVKERIGSEREGLLKRVRKSSLGLKRSWKFIEGHSKWL